MRTHSHPRRPISRPFCLFLCLSLLIFLLFPSFFSAPFLLVKGKRWHLGCCSASIVSSFLFFMVRRGVGIKNKGARVKERRRVAPTVSFFHLSLFSYIHLLPFPSHHADPHFPFNSPLFFLLFFLSLPVLPSSERRRLFKHTQRWYHRGSW